MFFISVSQSPKLCLNIVFCPTKCPKFTDSSFTVINYKEKQQILEFTKLESTFLLEKWSPAMTNWCDYYLIHCSIKMLINHQNNWWMNDKFIHMIKSLMTCYFNNNKYIIQFCPHHVLCTNIYYCSVCSFALYFFSKSLIHNTYLISCEIYRLKSASMSVLSVSDPFINWKIFRLFWLQYYNIIKI